MKVLSICTLVLLCIVSGCAVCEPGWTATCPCDGGAEGAQVCDEDGADWGPCDCGVAADDDDVADDDDTAPSDRDGDGYLDTEDCDDGDPAIYPGAEEVCDGYDNDCSGSLDDVEQDADGDGAMPCNGDCDDEDASVNPATPELPCDGIDNDCEPATHDVPELDGDGDGYLLCEDCDDEDAAVHPGAEELCNGIDDDCDGVVPTEESDSDNDGLLDCLPCDPMGGDDLQYCIDEAASGDVLDVGGTPLVANVSVSGKAITLVGDSDGSLTSWSCAETMTKAIVVGTNGEVTLRGFIFEGCNSGVIQADGAMSIHVDGCIFRDNEAYRGPAVSTYGGAGFPVSGSLVVENTIIHDNQAEDAGAIFVQGETGITIHNVLVYDNVADDYCGAIWLYDQVGSRLTFTKNVVYGNSAVRDPALEVYSGEGPVINSSIVTGNTPSDKASAWGSSYSMIGGEAGFTDPAAGDFSLQAGSPAIDAGDPSLPDDPDGTTTDQGCTIEELPVE